MIIFWKGKCWNIPKRNNTCISSDIYTLYNSIRYVEMHVTKEANLYEKSLSRPRLRIHYAFSGSPKLGESSFFLGHGLCSNIS